MWHLRLLYSHTIGSIFPDQIFLWKHSLISFSLMRISASPPVLDQTPGIYNLPSRLPLCTDGFSHTQLIVLPLIRSLNLAKLEFQWPLPSPFLSTSFQTQKAINSALKWSPHLDLSPLINAIWDALVQAYIISWQECHNRWHTSVDYPHWKQTFILGK